MEDSNQYFWDGLILYKFMFPVYFWKKKSKAWQQFSSPVVHDYTQQ